MPSRTFPEFSDELDEPVGISASQIRKVAIIGGGASGAILLDSLLQENHFDEIVLFERRPVLGGVWVLDEHPISTPNEVVKAGAISSEIDPPLENPFHEHTATDKIRRLSPDQERFEQTPAYSDMATNVIENMMTFSDKKEWIAGEKNKYVDRAVVQDYIHHYITKHKDKKNVRVVTSTTVEDVEKVHKDASIPYDFKLTLRHKLQDGTDEWYQEKFDAVVVSVGHYHIPFIPLIEGLREVQEQFPEVVHHAKFFRGPEPYKDKTIVVVGSRALGADLTKLTADTATEVYQLIRNETNVKRVTKKPNVKFKPVISRYEITDSGFKVVFGDDSELHNPDHVVYATGYQFSFPFLNRAYGDISKEGVILPTLYQHTFLLNEPLIALVGVPVDGISFRVFEYQAVLVARYLTGKIILPTRREQQKWIDKLLEEKGQTRAYHTIGVQGAPEYVQSITTLGATKAPIVGREFPPLTEDELAEYKAAGLKLAEFWDEPRHIFN